MKFSEKLQALRCAAGLSPEQLAGQLGVDTAALCAWESGAALPDAGQVVRISQRFGVSTDYLLLEETPASPARPAMSRPHLIAGGILTGVSAVVLLAVWVCARVAGYRGRTPGVLGLTPDSGYFGFVRDYNLSLLTRPCWLLLAVGLGLLLFELDRRYHFRVRIGRFFRP